MVHADWIPLIIAHFMQHTVVETTSLQMHKRIMTLVQCWEVVNLFY